MVTTGKALKTFLASPERDSDDVVIRTAMQLKEEPLLAWFHAVPMGTAIINRNRQILFCNEVFRTLSLKRKCEDNLGLRPGEALDCVNARLMEAGCGCSDFCNVCGAAIAIIKSLEGTADCRECRLNRYENGIEVPLDLQVFTRPIDFRGETLTIIFAVDISHEKRLKYLNRTFYHGLINSVGGMNALAELLEAGPEDSALFELLLDSSRRTLRDVLYHRDIDAAENGRLTASMERIDAGSFFDRLVQEECRLRNTQRTGTTVRTDCGSLVSDKRILGHVVRNMLVNAIEARESNPGEILLSCTQREDGGAAITMTNPGEIPEDIRKQMFKRYVSTKSRDRGLGVYVIKLFTEGYLRGTVSFTSGGGSTTFEITLPGGK